MYVFAGRRQLAKASFIHLSWAAQKKTKEEDIGNSL